MRGSNGKLSFVYDMGVTGTEKFEDEWRRENMRQPDVHHKHKGVASRAGSNIADAVGTTRAETVRDKSKLEMVERVTRSVPD